MHYLLLFQPNRRTVEKVPWASSIKFIINLIRYILTIVFCSKIGIEKTHSTAKHKKTFKLRPHMSMRISTPHAYLGSYLRMLLLHVLVESICASFNSNSVQSYAGHDIVPSVSLVTTVVRLEICQCQDHWQQST